MVAEGICWDLRHAPPPVFPHGDGGRGGVQEGHQVQPVEGSQWHRVDVPKRCPGERQTGECSCCLLCLCQRIHLRANQYSMMCGR